MKTTLDAIARRVMIFLGAVFGTFVLYLAIGELSGLTEGTPMEDATSPFVILALAKATSVLTAGHTVALGILAWARRGHIAPPLQRSAYAGMICATVLDCCFVAGPWMAQVSSRGLFRLVMATLLSYLICAVRTKRSQPEPSETALGAARVLAAAAT